MFNLLIWFLRSNVDEKRPTQNEFNKWYEFR